MFRPAWLFTSMLTVTMLTTPQLAFAWSEQHFPVTTSDGEKFADPDEKIERMAEPTSDHAVSLGSSFGSQTNKSGWSFSVTPQDSFAQSPYAMPRNLRAPNIGR